LITTNIILSSGTDSIPHGSPISRQSVPEGGLQLQLGVAERREYVSRRYCISKHTNCRAIALMADSEFSSVHWDSPPPSFHPDISETNHINSNDLMPTSAPTQTVPPEMDPLQAPPSNEHVLICVSSCNSNIDGSLFHRRRRRRMGRKMRMFRILSRRRYALSLMLQDVDK
jgi:hypothetical protein